jgi:hypothetical protein
LALCADAIIHDGFLQIFTACDFSLWDSVDRWHAAALGSSDRRELILDGLHRHRVSAAPPKRRLWRVGLTASSYLSFARRTELIIRLFFTHVAGFRLGRLGWRHGDMRRAASAWVFFPFGSSLQNVTTIRLSVWCCQSFYK